jgi:hypothetical protein
LIALGVDRELVFGHAVGQRLVAVGDPLAPDQRLVGLGLGPAALVELVGEVALLEVPAARRLGGQLVLGLVVGGGLGGDRAAQLAQLRGQVTLAQPFEGLDQLVVVAQQPLDDAAAAFAVRQHLVRRVVRRPQHDQCAAVELAGGLGAVDELPHPALGVGDVGVDHLRLAVLAGPQLLDLHRRQLVEADAQPGGRDHPGVLELVALLDPMA